MTYFDSDVISGLCQVDCSLSDSGERWGRHLSSFLYGKRSPFLTNKKRDDKKICFTAIYLLLIYCILFRSLFSILYCVIYFCLGRYRVFTRNSVLLRLPMSSFPPVIRTSLPILYIWDFSWFFSTKTSRPEDTSSQHPSVERVDLPY